MKIGNRILIVVVCVVLLVISWVVVMGSPSTDERQAELIAQAINYIDDGIYIFAVPLLEEAAGYNAAYTSKAEAKLKEVYLQLIDQRGFRRRYLNLLEAQMSRSDAPPEIFNEAANFHLENGSLNDAFDILRNGIARTGCEQLIVLFEENRYVYRMGHNRFDDVTAIFGTTIGVKIDGQWGIANSDGSLLIPTVYDKVSTFNAGRAIVQRDGEIFAVDRNNNRIALLREGRDFGNYAYGRIAILTDEGWRRATGNFEIGAMVFEEIGAYSYGFAAAKQNGRWGVIDRDTTWLIPPEHDGIIMDELGRAYAQGAVFVIKGGSVYLYVNGQQVGVSFENARPFGSTGYAAVKRNGMWGFINTSGELTIGYQFEDALSFGQHLAAVKSDGLWGYISLFGTIVIEPEFLQAKSFANGDAPVLTERGWRIISLIEYIRRDGGLF